MSMDGGPPDTHGSERHRQPRGSPRIARWKGQRSHDRSWHSSFGRLVQFLRSNSAAVNALYDLRVIWDRQRCAEQTQQLCRDTFERLVAAEADDWDLSSVAAVQSEVPSRVLLEQDLD